MTLTIANDDHKFSVSPDGDYGIITYEESLLWRGQIRVSEPDEAIWKMIMQSDKMTDYLEREGLDGVRRDR